MAEVDKGYEDYFLKTKRRFGLKDRHIGEGYIRGSKPDHANATQEYVAPSGMTTVLLMMEEKGIVVSLPPAEVAQALEFWQEELAAHPMEDKRALTRRMISEHLALNMHDDPAKADALACGAIWLASTRPDNGSTIREMLERGSVELRYDILFDDKARTRIFRINVTEFSDEG